MENQVNRDTPADVTLTGVESAHLATLLVVGAETIRMTALELLMNGDVEGAHAGLRISQAIREALDTLGRRQNGDATAQFDIPEGVRVARSSEVNPFDQDEDYVVPGMSGLVGGNLI